MILDITIIGIYLLLINVIGIASSRAKNMQDYFLGGREVPWPLACLSIVATETSTLTFISIPGLAYVSGTGFLHVALGYIAGRIFVAALLLPAYFKGNTRTVYEYLQQRFGEVPRRVIAVIFHITRILADGIRLFATAIPLAMLLNMESYRLPVLIIGLFTFFYTWYGGIRSVIVVDTLQFFLYLACAVGAVFVIMNATGSGFFTLAAQVPCDKFFSFSFGLDGSFFTSYNLFSGLIGGAFLSVASHGTDHLIVQRVLSCRSIGAARKAMVWSGVAVFIQFALFLLLGLFLSVFLGGKNFSRPDEIMPWFILHKVPPGFRGVMLAGIFAAAMSSLSSSINSLSASTAIDILRLDRRGLGEAGEMRYAKLIALFWTLLLVSFASFLESTTSSLVELGLAITSVTYGGVLGLFILARFFPVMSDGTVLAGMIAGIGTVALLFPLKVLFWPWFVPLGCMVSLLTSFAIFGILQFGRNRGDG